MGMRWDFTIQFNTPWNWQYPIHTKLFSQRDVLIKRTVPVVDFIGDLRNKNNIYVHVVHFRTNVEIDCYRNKTNNMQDLTLPDFSWTFLIFSFMVYII